MGASLVHEEVPPPERLTAAGMRNLARGLTLRAESRSALTPIGGSMLETTRAGHDPQDVQKESFIWLMAETLPLAGYAGVRADLTGWEAPEVIHGVVRDHRPSLSCEAPTPTFMDVLSPGPLTLEEVASRWQLFASAAELTGGEFHVVVPRWVAGRDGKHVAKQLAELVGVRIGYIWTV